jgi:adenylylsulfate kinase-like enzyme
VDADISICRERDVKGLYKKVDNGTMAQFTGVSAPFEGPSRVDLIVDTNEQTTDECLEQILHTFFDKR